MNKIKRAGLTLFVILAVAFCAVAVPAVPAGSNPPKETPVINGELKKENKGKRPRVPSRLYMEYQYDGNGILIIAPEMYPEFEISVTGEDAFYGTLNSGNGFYIETGSLEGMYVIACTTQDGSVYSGEMVIE